MDVHQPKRMFDEKYVRYTTYLEVDLKKQLDRETSYEGAPTRKYIVNKSLREYFDKYGKTGV